MFAETELNKPINPKVMMYSPIQLKTDSEKSPDRTSYVLAAWCYVNAFVTPLDIRSHVDLQRALDELYIYFGRSRKYGTLYEIMCEKAMIISFYQIETNLEHKGIWPSLLDRRKGFDKKANGSRLREFKKKNPQLVDPNEVTCRYVFRQVQRPGDDVREACIKELEEVKSADWIVYFDKAMVECERLRELAGWKVAA